MFTRRDILKGMAGFGIAASGIGNLALEPDYIAAHNHCHHHRREILSSQVCGCFCCLAVFTPEELWPDDWIDQDASGLGQTARCPNCGIDSVIGAKSGYPVQDRVFLSRMEQYWFSQAS